MPNAAWTVVGLNPHQCLWTHHLQVCGSKSRADICTVSRLCTRGESEDYTGKKACKGSTQALKPGADITRSLKQGYQWPREKELCPRFFFKKKHSMFQKEVVCVSFSLADGTAGIPNNPANYCPNNSHLPNN